MALYLDQALYNTPAKYFAALAALTDFWDTITDDTLTKGGVTLTLGGTTTVSGFGLTMTGTVTSTTTLTKTMIAYTDKGIIGLTNASTATQKIGRAHV